MDNIEQRASPNFGPRRGGVRAPDLIIVHYTAMRSAEEAIERLCDPAHEVSAHYVIARDGTVTQLVPEAMRAWHAGAGAWQGAQDVNSRSIGIELDNDGQTPFSAPLMDALEQLLAAVMSRHAIAPEAVIGHADIAPVRKSDPGARFDWRRLALGGFAVWPAPAGAAPDDDALSALGYDVAQFGRAACLSAYQTRFCIDPRAALT